MKKFRTILAGFLILATMVGGPIAVGNVATATPTTPNCDTTFLGFYPWYHGLSYVDSKGDCTVRSPSDPKVGGLSNFIAIIAMNVILIILQLIAYAAAIMIIVGGFRFLTSAGNASGVEQGKKTLTNAIIGLVISIAAIAIVKLIFAIINGGLGQ